LRWMVRWEDHGYVLRLRDDTGDSNEFKMYRCEFESPDTQIPFDEGRRGEPLRVSGNGGLFVAQSQQCRQSVIIPPIVVRSLSQLRIDACLQERPKNTQSLCELLALYEVWSVARITGNPFSARRRDDALTSFMRAIIEFTCGRDWVSEEVAFQNNKDHLPVLKSAISRRQSQAGFGAALFLIRESLAQKPIADRIATFSRLATSYVELPGFSGFPALSKDLYLWTTEFALRLMTKPQTLGTWAGGELAPGIEYVLKCPMLARGARFLALALASAVEPARAGIINLPNWEWT
jgi:hypothetical protein